MDAVCERTLKIILESAIETPDGFLFSKDIGIRGDERKRVCGYLLQHGYITQLDYIGQTKVQCRITEKALNFSREVK